MVFRHLDDESIIRLCESKEEKIYRKGEIINREGERITDFKYLKKGLVKIFRESNNRDEQVVTITRPFEFVSSVTIFTDEIYSYSEIGRAHV